MTKKKKAIIIITAIILAAAAFCFIYKPVYYRLYFGDRITGNVKLVIDGEAFPLDKDSFDIKQSGKITINDNIAEISFRAGDYGGYKFEIANEKLKEPIVITCFQPNWWNVMSFDITVFIDTLNDTVKYDGLYTTLTENGSKTNQEISKIQKFSDEKLGLVIGW